MTRRPISSKSCSTSNECLVVGQNIFEQLTQLGDIPLIVAELVDEPTLCLFAVDRERGVERVVGPDNLQIIVQHQKRHGCGVDRDLGQFLLTLGFLALILLPGDVVDCQQKDVGVMLRDLTRVDPHDALTDGLEVMLNHEVIDSTALWKDILQQFTQLRNVPLSIAKIVNRTPLCLMRLDMKRIVEGFVGT